MDYALRQEIYNAEFYSIMIGTHSAALLIFLLILYAYHILYGGGYAEHDEAVSKDPARGGGSVHAGKLQKGRRTRGKGRRDTRKD